jgi:hypothetical protein
MFTGLEQLISPGKYGVPGKTRSLPAARGCPPVDRNDSVGREFDEGGERKVKM